MPPPDGSSDPVPDPVYPDRGNPLVDVRQYDLTLAWAPATRVLTGTATLRLRAVRGGSQISLDFIDSYALDGATVDGVPVTATRRADHLVLALPRPLAAGAVVAATVRYHGTPHPVPFPGHRADVSESGARVTPDGALYAMQEPYGAYTWFPCNDQPSDKALLDVAVAAPAGWSAVTSGRFAGSGPAPGGGTTYRWHSPEPIATYLVAFAVDRYERVDDSGPHGLPVTYWLRGSDKPAMLPVLRRTPSLLAWLEQRLGPYPFGSAGVVIVADRSAMETQGMVTLGPLTGARAVPVLLHELSHHWFGDAVTPRTWQDVWLNEGFATYVQMLYETDQLGASLNAALRSWQAGNAAARAEAGPPGHFAPDHFAEHNVYFGPALMLHALRGLLGDPVFFAMLHDWPQHHRYTNQDRASFVAWVNGYTGVDVTDLVHRWLDA
jgi:aminopeptidase N